MYTPWRIARPPQFGVQAANKPLRFLPSGLGLAVLLGLLLLGFSAAQLREHIEGLSHAHRVTQAVAAQPFLGTSLAADVSVFVLAHLVLHVGLGIFAWVLAIATQYAWPALHVRRSGFVLSWFAALVLAVMLANASYFPWARLSGTFSIATVEVLRGVSVYDIYASALLILVATIVVRVVIHARRQHPIIARALIWGAVVWVAVGLWSVARLYANSPAVAHDKPHLIIIGVDSLRCDVVARGSTLGVAPEISTFLKEARVVSDVLSPLARTFPAWVSILTGRHPTNTGARDNLIPMERLRIGQTLADRLRLEGYRTIYATDEVRFSNIDERYGFDQVIAPKVGASDFLLATLNDLPLANLLSATRVGGWLFPNTYANRAASITYRPQTFVDRLKPHLDFSAPTLLAVHLTLPHWPYEWADSLEDTTSRSRDNAHGYLAAVRAVDRQFGALITNLERAGALENALVVVLSDHGEGLGLPSDNLIYSKEAKLLAGPLSVGMWGHGNSVLSPHQFAVVLAFRGFGMQTLKGNPRTAVEAPATLEDVTPTVLDLFHIRAAGNQFDGISLAAELDGGSPSAAALERVRFTESGMSTGLMKAGRFEGATLAQEAARQFRVDPESGRLELREDAQQRMIEAKELAAIKGDLMLAAIPDDGSQGRRYLFMNRRGGLPQRLSGQPELREHPDLAVLWQALHARFGDELREPVQ